MEPQLITDKLSSLEHWLDVSDQIMESRKGKHP